VLVGAPLLPRVAAGKAKKEDAIEETHRKGGGGRCGVKAGWLVEKIIESLVHLAQKSAICFGNERTHKHINLVFVITNTKIVLGSLH